MERRGHRRQVVWSSSIGALVALVGLGGCAHRDYFDQDAMAQTQASDEVASLRVYPEETIISVYDEVAGEGSEAEPERIKTIVSRNTAGLIVEAEQPDASALWVTFDPACSEAACAYRFGKTFDGRYRLVQAPPREGFSTPQTFRGREVDERRLSLDDAGRHPTDNDVFLTARR